MSVKLFCDRCGQECKKHWELRVHTDASCLRPDFTRVLCKSCAADIMSLVNPGTDASVAVTGQKAMDREHLIAALKMMQVETGSLVCLGCGHEHNCGVHGCAIIREAVEQLEAMGPAAGKPMTLEQLRDVAHGKIKDSTLQHICDRANEIASPPAHIDREKWKTCYTCRLIERAKETWGRKYKICPNCGRPMTEDAWAEYEKMLRGCSNEP